MKKVFYVKQEGHIDGRPRLKGEAIQLTEREAKYLLMNETISREPVVDQVEKTTQSRDEVDPAILDRKTR